MKPVKVFVPGKILISGEHAVVYGEPALAASVSTGVTVRIREQQVVSSKQYAKNPIIKKAIEVAGGLDDGVLQITSTLPVGSGMGSSAAVAAAVIRAVSEFRGKHLTRTQLFDLTMECERLAHGNPSGVDPAAVVYGGLIWYVKGAPIRHLNFKKRYEFLVVDSGKPLETTKEMVEKVKQQVESSKEYGEHIKQIGGVTKKMREALVAGDDIRDLINENGRLLEEIGVVSEQTQMLSQALRALGAGVKVSGAGGRTRGSGILLVSGVSLDTIAEFIKKQQLAYWRIGIGGH